MSGKIKAVIRPPQRLSAYIDEPPRIDAEIGGRDTIPAKWRGEWQPEETYAALQKVSHLGSSYVCIQACQGVDPEADVTLGDGTEGEYWILIAKKGERGEQGIQGERGPQGSVGAKGSPGDSVWVENVYTTPTQTVVEIFEEAKGFVTPVKIPNGKPFEYKDFTPSQLEGLRGPQGPVGAKGSPGYSVWVENVYTTPAQTIVELFEEHKGRVTPVQIPNGKPFEYKDFTPSQLEALRGPQGEQGEPGPSGIVAPINGFFSLSVDENGDLWAYSEDDLSLDFEFDPETGNLYVVQEV
jgi:hypothetical protein